MIKQGAVSISGTDFFRQFRKFLDTSLYRPLEQLIVDPAVPVKFQRVSDIHYHRAGVDLIMAEEDGKVESYLDERIQLRNCTEDTPPFAFEMSFIKNEEPEAGRLLDTMMKTTGYMLCWPCGIQQGNDVTYQSARALLVSKRRILSYLDAQGFSRRELALRDELIRRGGHPGRFRTRNSNFWFFFSGEHSAKAPIYVVMRGSLLHELATATMSVRYDSKQKTSTLQGFWVHRPVNGSVPVA